MYSNYSTRRRAKKPPAAAKTRYGRDRDDTAQENRIGRKKAAPVAQSGPSWS
jgi:hypothetical protein